MRTLAAIALFGFACDVEPPRTKPVAPDMSQLADAYAAPTSNFDEPAASEVQALVERRVRELVDFEALVGGLEAVLAALDEAGDSSLVATRSIVFEGDGYARIERICTGHGTPAPVIDKAANGFLELTVGYTEEGLDPVVFGGAVDCLEQVGSAAYTIRGGINLYIGPRPVTSVREVPLLVAVDDFRLDRDGVEVLSGGFDFQVCRGSTPRCVSGAFELLLGLASGRSLIFFIDPATKTGGFRAANGVWRCDFMTGTCDDGAGGAVMIPAYQL